MAKEQDDRSDRFQWYPGDLDWQVGPTDVPQAAQDAVDAREAAQLVEGRKVILREKLAAAKRSRRKG